MVSAMKCRGMSTQWITSQAVTAPQPPLTWTPNITCCGWTIQFEDNPVVISLKPPEPPPRSLDHGIV
jgi:hypothetical protein